MLQELRSIFAAQGPGPVLVMVLGFLCALAGFFIWLWGGKFARGLCTSLGGLLGAALGLVAGGLVADDGNKLIVALSAGLVAGALIGATASYWLFRSFMSIIAGAWVALAVCICYFGMLDRSPYAGVSPNRTFDLSPTIALNGPPVEHEEEAAGVEQAAQTTTPESKSAPAPSPDVLSDKAIKSGLQATRTTTPAGKTRIAISKGAVPSGTPPVDLAQAEKPKHNSIQPGTPTAKADTSKAAHEGAAAKDAHAMTARTSVIARLRDSAFNFRGPTPVLTLPSFAGRSQASLAWGVGVSLVCGIGAIVIAAIKARPAACILTAALGAAMMLLAIPAMLAPVQGMTMVSSLPWPVWFVLWSGLALAGASEQLFHLYRMSKPLPAKPALGNARSPLVAVANAQQANDVEQTPGHAEQTKQAA